MPDCPLWCGSEGLASVAATLYEGWLGLMDSVVGSVDGDLAGIAAVCFGQHRMFILCHGDVGVQKLLSAACWSHSSLFASRQCSTFS